MEDLAVRRALRPLEVQQKDLLQALSCLPPIPGQQNCNPHAAFSCVCFFTWPPFYKDTVMLDEGPILLRRDVILTDDIS